MKCLIWRCFWFENISVFLNREVILIYWPAKTQHAAHQNSENVCCIPLLHVISDNISAFLTFSLHEKWLNTELFLVRIFPHSDRIRRETPYLSVLNPNVRKYGPEKAPYLDNFHAVFWIISFLLFIKSTLYWSYGLVNCLLFTNLLRVFPLRTYQV